MYYVPVSVANQLFFHVDSIGCRILHLSLLGFHVIALNMMSTASGGRGSAFLERQNARALILVCSQVDGPYLLLLQLLFGTRHGWNMISDWSRKNSSWLEIVQTYIIPMKREYWICFMKFLLDLQKALLIVVAVVEQLNGALGQSGLLVIPCVAAHINQVRCLFLLYICTSIFIMIWIN